MIQMIDYQVLIPPIDKEIRTLSETEAKQYFDWYVKQCPVRSVYLLQKAGVVSGAYDRIVYTPDSLKKIWAWFQRIAAVGKDKDGEKKLTLLTEYIIRDVGMYLGETLTHNFSSLSWGYFTKPRNDFFVNTPGIMGFCDKQFAPPFPLFFDPIHMTGVQAAKILFGTGKKSDLYNLYMKWSDKVP